MTTGGSLTEIQERVGWRFQQPDLLERALTHKSWSNEQAGTPDNNERLEFLGDAVLDLVIGHYLFDQPERLPEGELTRVRAELVNEKTLASVARELDLGRCLKLGRGEALSGGADKDSLLSNAVEALFGALYLDGGYAAADNVIRRLFLSRFDRALSDRQGKDYKSRLQEVLQGRYGAPPRYQELNVEGPPHARVYSVAVEFRGKELARADGKSKKDAEQGAARLALEGMDG